MDVDAVGPRLHLFQPLHDGGVRVLGRVEQVHHLEVALVPPGERGLDVQQFVLALAVIKELRQLVQDDQRDRLVLVNDSLRVVDAVRTGKVHRRAMLLVSNLHRRLRDFKLFLLHPQAVDSTQHFLVHRLAQLVVPLAQDHHGSRRVIDKLVIAPDGREA